ncbi:hypothetical protein JCM19236_3351 [Vibrio sp. JCM 19236]|nr:hypothetical protein JCM19236_3351 [Vibrio sp. JCM 19236]
MPFRRYCSNSKTVEREWFRKIRLRLKASLSKLGTRHGSTIFSGWGNLCLVVSCSAFASAPDLKSATPVIYLADNLEEKDNLGWCIDTDGRGFSELLQAHSCKPAAEEPLDTQFRYIIETGQIRSVPYANKCMTLSDPENLTHPFGLLDCVQGQKSQQFVYDADSMEIRIHSDLSKCVLVAEEAIIAGPYMSRDLSSLTAMKQKPLRNSGSLKTSAFKFSSGC